MYIIKIFYLKNTETGVLVHTCHPNTWAAEAGSTLQVQGPSGLSSEFKASLNYIVRPYLIKKQQQQKCF